MPIVKLPDGKKVKFPDSMTPQEISSVIESEIMPKMAQPQTAQPEPKSFMQEYVTEPLGMAVEPLATLATGAIAEPIAGLAGLAKTITSGPEAGAETVRQTREGLTYQPKTEAGKESMQTIGGIVEPVGKAFQKAETFLGDTTFKATNSPALAAAAATIPTAITEALGLASAKGIVNVPKNIKNNVLKSTAKKAIVASVPDIDQIKDVSRAVYKELDNSGVMVKPGAYNKLASNLEMILKKEGLDPDITPQAYAAVNRLRTEKGGIKSLSDIDTLRKVAQGAADTQNLSDARLGNIIIENIDNFLDNLTPGEFTKGTVKASEVGAKYRTARELWGRARRSELINQAFENAKNQASGFENGIVVQFRSILNNKKKAKFFKPKELEIMREVVRGTTGTNIAKAIGRLGFTEGHATNILGGVVGATAGGMAFGTPGAVAVPVIGQVSRKLAQKLQRGKANYLDTVIRAGTNADDIAKAYIKNTPKQLRKAEELSELLLRPDIALDKLIMSDSKLLKEAAEIAKGQRLLQLGATVAAPQVKQQGLTEPIGSQVPAFQNFRAR